MTYLNSYSKIKKLVLTEKTSNDSSEGKYRFKVDKSLRKNEVQSIFKDVFGVDVVKVNSLNKKPKVKKFKGVEGKRAEEKILIISLKKDQKIDFQEIEVSKK
jgi:large subunit ribosomal protein L23